MALETGSAGLGADARGLGPWTPRALGGTVATASARSVAAVAALAVIVIGAAPMAVAAANRTADPILALAIAGGSTRWTSPGRGFALTDQNGRTVTLASLRGKVVLMTFLDPVCTTDCPLIGEEFKQTGVLLASKDKDVDLVAIVANPTYRSVEFTRAFDREDGLTSVPNWLYLTGSLSQLSQVWRDYGVTVQNLPAGAMSRTTTWRSSSIGRATSARRSAPTRGQAPRAPSPRSRCCSASTPARRCAREPTQCAARSPRWPWRGWPRAAGRSTRGSPSPAPRR